MKRDCQSGCFIGLHFYELIPNHFVVFTTLKFLIKSNQTELFINMRHTTRTWHKWITEVSDFSVISKVWLLENCFLSLGLDNFLSRPSPTHAKQTERNFVHDYHLQHVTNKLSVYYSPTTKQLCKHRNCVITILFCFLCEEKKSKTEKRTIYFCFSTIPDGANE